jgi:hypothetical protein
MHTSIPPSKFEAGDSEGIKRIRMHETPPNIMCGSRIFWRPVSRKRGGLGHKQTVFRRIRRIEYCNFGLNQQRTLNTVFKFKIKYKCLKHTSVDDQTKTFAIVPCTLGLI